MANSYSPTPNISQKRKESPNDHSIDSTDEKFDSTIIVVKKKAKLYVSEPGRKIWFKSTNPGPYAFLSNFWPFNISARALRLTDKHLAQFGAVNEAKRPFQWDGLSSVGTYDGSASAAPNDTQQLYCGREMQTTIPCSSVEHAYQAAKFNGGDVMLVHDILNQPTALDAKKTATILRKNITQKTKQPSREDHWQREYASFEGKKREIMKSALRAKFSNNIVLRKALVDTAPAILCEVPGRSKSCWAGECGLLGTLLMEVRDEMVC